MAINEVVGSFALSPSIYNTTKVQNIQDNSVNFSKFLNDAISKVNNMQVDAETQADDFAAGKTDNIHGVMIAAEKADVALQFTMQIRNKVIDAYNEIMRMQI